METVEDSEEGIEVAFAEVEVVHLAVVVEVSRLCWSLWLPVPLGLTTITSLYLPSFKRPCIARGTHTNAL